MDTRRRRNRRVDRPRDFTRHTRRRGRRTEPEERERPELQKVRDEYVRNPRDDWYTETDLGESGYRREALVDLCGKPVPGHDGVIGWTA